MSLVNLNLHIFVILFISVNLITGFSKRFQLIDSNLQTLVKFEIQYNAILRKCVRNYPELKDSEGLNMYFQDFDTSSAIILGTVKPESEAIAKIARNPILILRMIYRLVEDDKEIQLSIYTKMDIYEEIGQLMFNTGLNMPQSHHLEEAVNRLLQIQKMNGLDAFSIAFGRGILSESIGRIGLMSRHILGLVGMISKNVTTMNPELLAEWAKIAITQLKDEVDLNDEYYKLENRLNKLIKQVREEYSNHSNAEFIISRNLCRGINLQAEPIKSSLYCRLDTASNPAWKINPLRIEILSKFPSLIQIHNIISDSLAKQMISEAEPLLVPSMVYDSNQGKAQHAKNIRISHSAWLPDFKENIKLSKLLEYITGLRVVDETASEKLQVISYTPGGYYGLHMDAFGYNIPEVGKIPKGDRIATAMIYLSETEPDSGGYTVFPEIGTFSVPTKGSIVFWYNLNEYSLPDRAFRHGGCPLLFGKPKWIANKWIFVNDQFLTRKCPVPVKAK